MSEPIYDFIGIGLGPFNLSLACLTDPISELNGLFLEQRPDFNWHPGLMFEDAHLQTPFMSDLVTLADPTHPLSFLNYAKQHGKLYSFYIRENFFLLRREYNHYCQWACEQLSSIRFNCQVNATYYDEEHNTYCLTVVEEGQPKTYYARKLVLGTGPAPYVPDCCEVDGKSIIHAGNFLEHKDSLQQQASITLVGSGQTAAEIFYQLLQDIDQYDYELNWLTRSPRFFPLEYTKLTLEMTSPEWVDYFYALPTQKRDALNRQHKNLYKGINSDLINAIHDLLYSKQLHYPLRCQILTNSSLQRVEPKNDSLNLHFEQHQQEQAFQINTERLVLATGYQYQPPEFLQGIAHRIHWDEQGRFAVSRYYSIDHQQRDIFVQNAELHTHGFVTPDLGMACYRNSCIIREMLGYEYYPIEQRIGFQQFSTPNTTTDTEYTPHPSLERQTG